MSEVVYVTAERLKAMQEELHDLKSRGRREIAGKIADARSHGDLSENAEYDAAKDEQGLLEMKINRIEVMIARSQVIKAEDLPNDKVYILSNVRLKNTKNGAIIEYMLVSDAEADFEKKKLSVNSPLGRAMMGRKIGDIVEFQAPVGKITYEILEIFK